MTSTDHPRFPHLFRPYNLKGVELRNRVAISGHFAGWWVGPGGLPSDAFVAYVEERAKGSVGLFTIGATSPEPGSGWMQNLDDAIIPRYRLLADAAHRHGTKMPLGVRLKLDDIIQRGMGPDDYRECVRRLEAQRLVDYLVFAGGDGRFHHGPMPRPEGEWLPLVREMRHATKLTIMHAGRITTPEMAEKALAENLLDIVCMTKTHICDPHFTRKVFENRLDDIRYCTRCLQVCHGKMDVMSCVYNPFKRRELEGGGLKPAAPKRRIVIVGAGPAGMEAAWNAGMRGHEVIVFEQSHRVGGQIWVGASSPLRKNWGRIAEFYERQSKKGIFSVRLHTRATKEKIKELKPD